MSICFCCNHKCLAWGIWPKAACSCHLANLSISIILISTLVLHTSPFYLWAYYCTIASQQLERLLETISRPHRFIHSNERETGVCDCSLTAWEAITGWHSLYYCWSNLQWLPGIQILDLSYGNLEVFNNHTHNQCTPKLLEGCWRYSSLMNIQCLSILSIVLSIQRDIFALSNLVPSI